MGRESFKYRRKNSLDKHASKTEYDYFVLFNKLTEEVGILTIGP